MPRENTVIGDARQHPLERAVIADLGAKIGFMTAVIWILFGLESIVHPHQDNIRDAVWMLPGGLTFLMLWLVHLVQRSPQARLERIGFVVVMLASGLVLTVNIALVSNLPALANLTAGVGIVSWIVGLLIYGIATLKTGVLPKWVGWAILLFEPGSVLTGLALSPIAPLCDRGAYSAGVEKGAALAVVAVGLVVARNTFRGRNARSVLP